ncbi:MAG: argininosuccinate lyase [Magnetococcales bacterium]|nr:argininosuccinate lyase [Magnetococcales bacterium]
MSQNSQDASKLWGGRFSQPTNAFVEAFSASIHYDVRLFRQDIRASKVHCQMLARQGIIPAQEAETIQQGLDGVLKEIEAGQMVYRLSLEDVHMHVESRLHELIGPVAGKLHTARSRNDQVATDVRLYLREEVDCILDQLLTLQTNLLVLAHEQVESVMPGFTHLQIAQPVSFGHHLMAYVAMLRRDGERFTDVRKRINRMPLGSAALAGTPHPLDRHWVAEQLGFEEVCENSMDGVSDRDFAIEFSAAAAITMMHLSRLSEELILWSSPMFAFVELTDAFCTGSSIMPQKKNPDVPELIRGKTGRVYGDLISLLTLMKGLPMTYNRDMQEDKEPLFDAVDTLRACLRAMGDLVPGIQVKKENMARAAREGFATATDLADYLVKQGIPFREAHHIVGRIVAVGVATNQPLDQWSLQQLQQMEPRIGEDGPQALTVEASVNARQTVGGTAFNQVRQAIQQEAHRLMQALRLLENGKERMALLTSQVLKKA